MTQGFSPGIWRWPLGFLGALWGLAGILAVLGYAVVRLSRVFLDAFSTGFLWYHWLVLIGHVLFMAYSEGYKGFQKAFSPRVAARAKHLYTNPHPVHALFGPLFCVGYFHIKRSKQRMIIGLTLGIVALIALVRILPQPWRGIIDGGVVVGLLWGLVTLGIYTVRTFASSRFAFDPEITNAAMKDEE